MAMNTRFQLFILFSLNLSLPITLFGCRQKSIWIFWVPELCNDIMLISNYKNYIIIILHQDYKNKEMIKVGVNDAASYLLDA